MEEGVCTSCGEDTTICPNCANCNNCGCECEDEKIEEVTEDETF